MQTQLSGPQVIMMFREFGIDLAARMTNVQSPQEAVKRFDEVRADCKKAFKKLAFKLHPDRNDGDDTEFKRINQMWQILEQITPTFPRPQPIVTIVVNPNFWGVDQSTGGF